MFLIIMPTIRRTILYISHIVRDRKPSLPLSTVIIERYDITLNHYISLLAQLNSLTYISPRDGNKATRLVYKVVDSLQIQHTEIYPTKGHILQTQPSAHNSHNKEDNTTNTFMQAIARLGEEEERETLLGLAKRSLNRWKTQLAKFLSGDPHWAEL